MRGAAVVGPKVGSNVSLHLQDIAVREASEKPLIRHSGAKKRSPANQVPFGGLREVVRSVACAMNPSGCWMGLRNLSLQDRPRNLEAEGFGGFQAMNRS